MGPQSVQETVALMGTPLVGRQAARRMRLNKAPD